MVPRVGFRVPGVLSVPVVLVLLIACGVQVSTQERFADVLFQPNRTGEQARGCCVIRAGEIAGTGVTARQVMEAAYRRHAFDRREVIGGPAWIDEDRFDFVATVAGDHVYDRTGFAAATFAILRTHVNLNARLRTEIRQRPAYALVSTGGRGPGLTPSSLDCPSQVRVLARGQKVAGPVCGASPYPGRLMARGITMADLSSLMSMWTDRPVIDRSGLSGLFDVDVEGVEIRPKGPFGPSYRPSAATASIVDTAPAQLGLRLERVMASIEVIVVDSAERPQ